MKFKDYETFADECLLHDIHPREPRARAKLAAAHQAELDARSEDRPTEEEKG